MLKADRGSVDLYGLKIISNDEKGSIETLRENLGMCPQHNILLNSLTPREHLDLFVAFKSD